MQLKIAYKPRDEHNLLAHEFLIGIGLLHVNFVRYFDFVEEADFRVLVTEVVEGRPFLEPARGPYRAHQRPRSPIFHQLQDGLNYLHTKGIVHANLNPASVLLDKTGSLKIGDLRYAAPANSTSSATLDHARILYGSPEHLTGALTKESDYFSVGMLLYEQVSGTHPFGNEDRACYFLGSRGPT